MLSVTLLVVTCFRAHAGPVMAGGPYAIVTSVALAGQGPMLGGDYRTDGTIGELSAPSVQRAGVFRLYSGFWQGERFIPLCLLDIDENGVIDAASDGVLIARAMGGFTGPALIADALAPNAKVTSPEQIRRRINIEALDADGSGEVSLLNDGLILMRAMIGLTGSAALEGAINPTATRTNWAQVRAYLNAKCGASFGP